MDIKNKIDCFVPCEKRTASTTICNAIINENESGKGFYAHFPTVRTLARKRLKALATYKLETFFLRKQY